MELKLGRFLWDLANRALVMGILNRTPDSFFDRGAHFQLDELFRLAERHVSGGADLLDVGGVPASAGAAVGLDEELDRVVPVVTGLVDRFDIAVSVDTWRAEVAAAAFAAGAVLGNDISGFSDPRYLPAAARVGAGVVATHIRRAPRVPDPAPIYDDVVGAVQARLVALADSAISAGVSPSAIVLDAGLDLGKTTTQSLELLRASDRLASTGFPLLLSASDKDFLGDLFLLDVHSRRGASVAAAALGVAKGCRIVRTHDVVGIRRVCVTLAAVLDAAQADRERRG